MATFPTAADMRRTVPRTEAGGYRVGRAAELSTADAETAFAQGTALKEIGALADRFGQQLDETTAQDALNRLRTKRQELTYDPQGGFTRLMGDNALKPGASGKLLLDEMPAKFSAAIDEIGAGLLSPRARGLYQQAATAERNGFKKDVAMHVAAQQEAFTGQVLKDTVAVNVNAAPAASGDPAQLEILANRSEQVTRKYFEDRGLPADAAVAAARSNVLSAGIKARIAQNDAPGALALFNRFSGRLDANDRVQLQAGLKTVETGMAAQQFVASPTGGDSYETALYSYESGKMEFNKLGSGAFGPAQFMPATWADVRRRHPELNLPADMTTATMDHHRAAEKAFRADNGAALQAAGLPASPANLYLAHRAGAGGAKAILQANPDTSLRDALATVVPAGQLDAWFAQNPDMRGQTAGSFIALANQRMGRVTSAAPAAPTDSRVGDPLATQVNDITAGRPGVRSLDDAVNAATAGPPSRADGPPGFLDTRRMLIDLNDWRTAKTAENQRLFAANPAQFSANQQQIEQQYGARQQAIQNTKLKLDYAVDEWMTKGGPGGGPALDRPPPEVWNQLTYEKQRSIDGTLAHNAKGREALTDQQVWYEIQRGLTSADPQERARWAAESLWQFKNRLSNADFQELARMQGAARQSDPEKQLTHVRNINQLVDDTLLKLKIDPTPKAGSGDADRAQGFRRRVQDAITALEKDTGKKATTEQQQKIIDNLALEITGTGGWFSNKRRYELTIGDVPTAERAKIADALTRAGVPVTDEAVIDLFARKNAKAPK